MRNLLLCSTAAISLAAGAQAQEAGALQAAIDSGIEMLNAQGANITYESREVGSDNSLTFNGFRMAPDGDEALQVSTDWIRFSPAGDMQNGVTVTVAPVVKVAVRDDDVTIDLDVGSEDFALTTNLLLGDTTAPRLDLGAGRVAVTGGGQVEQGIQDIDVVGEGLDVSFAFDMAIQGGTATATLDSLTADVQTTAPDGSQMVGLRLMQEATKIDFAGEGLPLSGDEDDLLAFLSSGGSVSLSIESGASSTMTSGSGPDMPVGIASQSEGGTMSLAIAEGMFNYSATGGAISYAITPDPQVLPLPPMDVAMESLDMVLQAPVAPSETSQQARLVLALRNLAVSDSAWALIDPAGTIPRDPATLDIDLSSMLRLLVPLDELEDVDDPTQAAEIDTLDIDRLHLDAGGAELDAQGALAIDNSGPIPFPNGAIEISVRGAQTLAQKLVALGLVDEMQVGMVMGMLMAFAEQGDSPDHYTSTIEFKDGGVLANGQPIQ
jgi:hypothetical protein